MIAIFPKIAECAYQGDPERLACMVRQYFGDAQTYAPILDLGCLYKQIGISINRMSMDGAAALVGRDERGKFSLTAVINPFIVTNKCEEAFALAHLLGHYFFHVQPKILRGEWSNPGVKESLSPELKYIRTAETEKNRNAKDRQEMDQIADHFAVSLLIPIGMLKRSLERIKNTTNLANFFGVSESVLKLRIRDLHQPIPQNSASVPEPQEKAIPEAGPITEKGLAKLRAIAQRLEKPSTMTANLR